MIISVDHGNKSIKTPNALFTSGLISSEGLQGFKTDYICWKTRTGRSGETQRFPIAYKRIFSVIFEEAVLQAAQEESQCLL